MSIEKEIERLSSYALKAKENGRKNVLIRLDELMDIIDVLIEKQGFEREPVAPVPNEILNSIGWHDMFDCGACGTQLRHIANYCDVCGRPVKRKD